ncbi:hypothetical protein [Streptosporangium carneum]|uniref:DinB-like domain-containing protein n=1 Tax=Streptosporangium carneum TaxID=47481 RepID=A0A9W6I5M3_9ACTN|nr:hypothetical protein [Streptosporangium carneum]GLK12510.1 hypothetical protein GCM10017600_59200 [Streptosporangium carneum]
MEAGELDWSRTPGERWEFHWNHRLRAWLDGLTDDECFRSPAPDAWSVRPRGGSTVPVADPVPRIRHELIHRPSEVCLLRGLYPHTKPATNGATR